MDILDMLIQVVLFWIIFPALIWVAGKIDKDYRGW